MAELTEKTERSSDPQGRNEAVVMARPDQKELVFVGYTNGLQILYATKGEGGEGAFYADTDNGCYIPLYMLRTHWHRLESTTGGEVTLERIKAAQKA